MSISLNGVSQYLNRTSAVQTAHPIGIFGWMKVASNTVRHSLGGVGSTTTDGNHYALVGAAGEVANDPCRYITTGSAFIGVNAGTFGPGVWHTFGGASFDTNNHAVYLNGCFVAATTASVGAMTPNRTSIGADGRQTTANFANAFIAEVGIWDLTAWGASATPRKAAWDAALCALQGGARVSDYPTGLKLYLPLISDALDASGNGNDMTEIGSPTYSSDSPPPLTVLSAVSTATDDFTRANSAFSMGTAAGGWQWNSINGLYGITSNQGYGIATNTDPIGGVGDIKVRAEIDLTSVDHYAQIVIPATDSGPGPCVRFNASTRTFYHLRRTNSTTLTLFRVIAGAFTSLTTFTTALSAGQTLRLEVSGTGSTVSLNAKLNGASVGTYSDTAGSRIVSGVRTGIRSAVGGATAAFDNFEAGSLGASAFNPVWAIGANQFLGAGVLAC